MNKKKNNKPKPLPQSASPDLSKKKTVKEYRTDILCWAVLFIIGAILYGHTLNAPWYLDDLPNIVHNTKIHDLFRSLQNSLGQRGPANFSFALNYNLSELNLPGFHATNILIHILTSGLVYLIAKRIFPSQWLYAALIALIFLVHPLQTQAVTYVVQRMASMAALFGFLSLYLYILARELVNRGIKRSNTRHLCLWSMALVTCYLAVKTKENLTILPLAMLLFEYFYLPRKSSYTQGLKERIIYFSPFFLPSIFAIWQRLVSPLSSGVSLQDIANVQEAGITPIKYLVTEFNVIWIYLKLLIIPYPQMLDYAYPITKTLLTTQNVMAFTSLAILLSAAFLSRNRYPHLSFGILWFFLGLAVESTLIPLDPVFEHRVYLSMFGFSVFIVGAGHYFLPKRSFIPLVLCFLLLWGGLSWRRNQMWNDEFVLYMDNAKYITADEGFNIALSKIFVKRQLYHEAIDLLSKTVENGAKKVGVYVNLAVAYRLNNQPNKAIEIINGAFDKKIRSTDLKIELARSHYKLKEYEKAAEIFKNILNNPRRYNLIVKELGLTLSRMGQYVEAEPYLQLTLKIHPDSETLRIYIAQARIKKGDMATAEKLIREVVEKNPSNVSGWLVFGLIGFDTDNVKILNEARERLYRLDEKQAQRLEKIISVRRP